MLRMRETIRRGVTDVKKVARNDPSKIYYKKYSNYNRSPSNNEQKQDTMAHIDETLLDTDVYYRFTYLSRHLEFGQEDMRLLQEHEGFLAPLIAEMFFKVANRVLDFDIGR